MCGPPSIPLSFTLACILPSRRSHCVSFGTGVLPPTPAPHRLGRGLRGYLILFGPHDFVPECHLQALRPPSPLVFFHISKHFNAKRRVPPPSPVIEHTSFQSLYRLSPYLSLQTCHAACAPFTPNHSGYRLPPTYYRGCWHVVSRDFLAGYYQKKSISSSLLF